MTRQGSAPEKRRRGRPALRTEDETRAMLIETARARFLADGYAGTSIEAVAQQAGVSTRTIYKTVSNKADLFRLVVEEAIETSIAHLNEPLAAETPVAAIMELTRAYAELVLGRDGVRTTRAILSEQAKFPRLCESYLSSIRQVAEVFDRRFVALCADLSGVGQEDAAEAAVLLRNMLNGAQRLAVLDLAHEGRLERIAEWSDRCTRFALRALGVDAQAADS